MLGIFKPMVAGFTGAARSPFQEKSRKRENYTLKSPTSEGEKMCVISWLAISSCRCDGYSRFLQAAEIHSCCETRCRAERQTCCTSVCGRWCCNPAAPWAGCNCIDPAYLR